MKYEIFQLFSWDEVNLYFLSLPLIIRSLIFSYCFSPSSNNQMIHVNVNPMALEIVVVQNSLPLLLSLIPPLSLQEEKNWGKELILSSMLSSSSSNPTISRTTSRSSLRSSSSSSSSVFSTCSTSSPALSCLDSLSNSSGPSSLSLDLDSPSSPSFASFSYSDVFLDNLVTGFRFLSATFNEKNHEKVCIFIEMSLFSSLVIKIHFLST